MSKARIVVVGAGWWAQGWHLPQLFLNPEVKLVAIVEPNPNPFSAMATLETTEMLGRRYSTPIFDSIDSFFCAGIEADGFVVSSTHSTHFDISIKVILSKKHLLLEKPMTVNIQQAEALCAQVIKSAYNNFFQINHSANWRVQTKRAAMLMKQRAIGEITHIQAHMGSPLKHLFEDPLSTGWIKLASGEVSGFGWGQLTHLVAWVLLVSDLDPIECFAMMGYSTITGADIFNAGTVRFSNGATMSISGVATVVPSIGNKQIENRIFGTEGMLSYCGNDGDRSSGSLEVTRFDGQIFTTEYDGMKEADGFLFENTDTDGLGPESLLSFIDACLGREGCWMGASPSLGLKVIRLIDALYRSGKSKQLELI